ncbi:MAG: fibronectin type III domain-containing protein [Candidatus Eisenbacteria bacterium]
MKGLGWRGILGRRAPFAASVLVWIGLAFCLAGATPALSADYGPEASLDPSPTRLPDRIILTWTGEPSTTQAVTWRTNNKIKDAFAEIARADASPDFHEGARRVRAKSEALRTRSGAARFHSVEFTGLEPNTVYAYRIGSKSGWSEWFQFRTAAGEPGPFSFIYLGDAQNNILAVWSRVIRAAYAAAPDARFLLHAGDLVTDGDSDALWGEWFHAGGWIHATVPAILVAGNHEYVDEGRLNDHWRAQFTLPENGVPGLEETAYFIDYQGARIVVLNSCEKLERQAAWLEGVLSDNPNAWTVVAFHHPVYSAAGDRDNEKLRRLWKPLLDRHGVDLVLQGHDHAYARGKNLPGEAGAGGVEQGPMYVVSVSGPKMYELTSDRWMDRAAENTQLFQVISVDGDTLRFEAFTATGALYDAFDLVKGEGPGSRLIDRCPPGLPERTF